MCFYICNTECTHTVKFFSMKAFTTQAFYTCLCLCVYSPMGLRVCAVYTAARVFLKRSALEESEKAQAHPLLLCPEPLFHQVSLLPEHHLRLQGYGI